MGATGLTAWTSALFWLARWPSSPASQHRGQIGWRTESKPLQGSWSFRSLKVQTLTLVATHMPSPCTSDAAHQRNAAAPEMPAQQLPGYRLLPAGRCTAGQPARLQSRLCRWQASPGKYAFVLIRLARSKAPNRQGHLTAQPCLCQCSRHTVWLSAIHRLDFGADCQIRSRLRTGGASDHHYRLSRCAPHATAALTEGCHAKLVMAGMHCDAGHYTAAC